MGTAYLCLCRAQFSRGVLSEKLGGGVWPAYQNPFVWWRYIDDIFMIWTEGEDNLKTFINYLNSIHPTIKFTHEYSNSSNQSLPFLDVQVHLNNNQIQTDLHTKPTDKHQYLLKSSCHPTHTKRTIPFSLALRLRRICSTDHFFNKRCYELINYLALRGYSRRLLKREVNRVRNISRQEALKPRPQTDNPGGGVLPYKGLMGTCGQPGYVFQDFCLKQGIKFIIFCLNQGIDLSIFVLNRMSFLGR